VFILLLSFSSAHGTRRLAARLSMVFLLALVLGCGATGGAAGGGGGGGNGGGGSGMTPTSITLSTSALKVPYGANLTFTVNVKSLNSSQPATGTADLWDSSISSSAGLAASIVSNGIATFQISYLSVGTHVISAQYYGDGRNQASKTNGSINVVITGTAPVFVQGTTSILTHNIPINVTIQ
jgi:Big-like domain-containing protein